MTFKIEFETDTAVFEEDYVAEVERILTSIMERVYQDGLAYGSPVFDADGNRIGEWSKSS